MVRGLDLDDPPQRAHALVIEKAERQEGEAFKVAKSTHWPRVGQRSTFDTDTWDHFPTEPDAWEAVGEQWGGGICVIKCRTGPPRSCDAGPGHLGIGLHPRSQPSPHPSQGKERSLARTRRRRCD